MKGHLTPSTGPWCWLLLTPLLLSPVGLGAQEPAEADWTAILLMSANYDMMEERLSWTGSTDRVNVLVLHDDDGEGIRAYRMLPDTNPDHPAGKCYLEDDSDSCDSEDLPLADMGINGDDFIYSDGVLERFLSYVVAHYPARRYLISVRGQMNGPHLLQHNAGGGMMISTFRDALEAITTTTGNRIDVLNFGFCLGAVVDWAYALRNHVEYFVASANNTNPPVATRWRFYRWVRKLIQEPGLANRALAQYITETFAETTDYCHEAGHQCTNTTPPNDAPYNDWDEPWTSTAFDLRFMDSVASASRELVCELLRDFPGIELDFEQALSDAAVYGLGYDTSYIRPDLKYFAIRLGDLIDDPAMQEAVDGVIVALDEATIHNRYQVDPPPPSGTGWFDGGDNAYGFTAFVAGNQSALNTYREGFLDYQLASAWRLLVETRLGEPQPALVDLSIEPATIELHVGDTIELTARGVSAEYGPMCAVAVDWDTSDLRDMGELAHRGNPTAFRALHPGEGRLGVSLGNLTASTTIRVSAP